MEVNTVKAIITDGCGGIFLKQIPVPELGDYDCLVKIKSCLFCSTTDRHIVENSFDFGLKYPVVLGHESIGEVIEKGGKVRNFSTGDMVSRAYALYPDECDNEGNSSGWGGFAEYGKIRDWKAMLDDGIYKTQSDVPGFFLYMQKLPRSLDWRKAMMISCQKEIYSALKKVPFNRDASYLIAGAGAAGTLFAEFLKKKGAGDVTLTARREDQLQAAQKISSADDALTFDNLRGPYDILIDTSGSAGFVIQIASRFFASDSKIYSYAIYPEAPLFKSVRIDPLEYSVHDEISSMLADGTISCAPYISSEFNIDDAEAAWRAVIDKKGIKIAIIF